MPLHGNDTELILLVDPDKESFVLVVEDTTALGPVTFHTGNLQVGVTRHEEEVVVDELLADGHIHTGQGIVVTSQISFQLGESVLQEWTGTSGSTLAVILEASMSEVCLKSAARPWYSQMRGSKTSLKSM